MSKILEKALKDAIKENKCQLGTKQVLKTLKNSKLIVVSDSIQEEMLEKIQKEAKQAKIPTVKFDGSSVALGKLGGLQFRVSTASFNSLAATNVKSIIKEVEKKS